MRSAAGARLGATLLLLPLLAAAPETARAHELRPAMLALTEIGPEEYEVDLRIPALTPPGEVPAPSFPAGTERIGGTARSRAGDASREQFRVRVPGGLAGRRLEVRFPGGAPSEVLVRLATRDGRTAMGRLLPRAGEASADWLVPAVPSKPAVMATYLKLGMEHIRTGLDHLAFVLGLVLLTPAWRGLWKSITAFTAAHSLTLALATLGVVRVPPPPVEAAIALSILFLAREVWLAYRGRPGFTARRPWPVAFAFGLLHGLGFAGALGAVGLPESDIPLALLAFNVGVELGQLGFVLVLLGTARALARLPITRNAWLRLAPAYAMGTLAVFWCIERVVGFWS